VRPADLHRLLSPRVVGGALSLQLVLAAGALAGPWAVQPVPPAGAARPAAAAGVAAAAPAPAPRGPVRLAAPALWDGPVAAQPLGLDADGSLEVPATAAALGWWADGARPGEPGAAVVVGHVDLRGAPGVFGRLADARPGMVVTVTDDRGRPVRFRVVEVARYAKADFPTDVVYAPTADAELRLVTCGGRFDPRTGHYADNVVVRAVLA
jgi:hypothetical protein